MQDQRTASPFRYDDSDPERPFRWREPYPEFPGELGPENNRDVIRAAALEIITESAERDPNVRYASVTARDILDEARDRGALTPDEHDTLTEALREVVRNAAIAVAQAHIREVCVGSEAIRLA